MCQKIVRSFLLCALCLLGGCGQRGDDPRAYSIVARMLPLSVAAPAVPSPPNPGEPRYEVAVLQGRGYRAVTLAASSASVTWPVEVPRSARLRFGYTAVTPSAQGLAPGKVLVTVDFRSANGRTTRLFRTNDTLEVLRWAPREIEVGLEGVSGRGELLFSAVSAAAPADASIRWLNPLLLGPGEKRRKNLIIICVDTLRADRLTDPGGRESPMPAMTKRLAEGAVFPRAYANSTWSLPSMATILTGLYPGNHHAGRRTITGPAAVQTEWNAKTVTGGIELVMGGKAHRFQMLHPSIVTLPEILGERGYETAAIHNNGYIDPATQVLQGADFFERYAELDAAVGTDEAIRWLSGRGESDFFLFLHYIDPHQWPTRFPPELLNKKLGEVTGEERARILQTYDELCRYTDQHLDRLFVALEELGLREDTYVVLLADHGERFFDWAPIGGFSGHGASFHETVLRVPLVLWGPGIEPRRVGTRVNLVDVVPTALDLLGIDAGELQLSGKSLLPLLGGTAEPDREVLSEYLLWGDDHMALVRGDWKYLAYEDAGRDLLFDLTAVPRELTSVLAAHAELGRPMRRDLVRHRRGSDERFARLKYGETRMDPETYESLKALGYVGN